MSASSKRKIVFLLGSGISIPAGMPKLHEITERVLSGEGIYYHEGDFSSNVRPYVEPAKKRLEEEQKENVRRIVKFLQKLNVEVDYYYEKQNIRHETNYEDLCYVSSQISDCIFGDIANPVVQSFIDKISPDIQPLLEGNKFRKEWRPVDLADNATKYIKFVVCHLLSHELTGMDYLSFVKDVCRDCHLRIKSAQFL